MLSFLAIPIAGIIKGDGEIPHTSFSRKMLH